MKKGIQLNNMKLVNTILYADDQILTTTSEDVNVNVNVNGNVGKRHTGGKNCDKR